MNEVASTASLAPEGTIWIEVDRPFKAICLVFASHIF